MKLINGVLQIKIRNKIYHLNEKSEIIYDYMNYHSNILYKKVVIPKSTIKKLIKENIIYLSKNDVSNLRVVYKVTQTSILKVKINQELYYRGLNWGSKTYCFDKEIQDDKVIIHANNGVFREEQEVLNNSCDLYTNKEDINKTLIGVYMGNLIK